MARGWRYTKLSLSSALLCVASVCVCDMHPLYCMGSLRVSASYLSFSGIRLCVYVFFSLSLCRFPPVFNALVEALLMFP